MYTISKEKKQEFDNGCTVWYLGNNECYWDAKDGYIGTCPYGQDTLYTTDTQAVKEWLESWEDDRDETGALLNMPKEDTYFKEMPF